jgi:hypothetical protein
MNLFVANGVSVKLIIFVVILFSSNVVFAKRYSNCDESPACLSKNEQVFLVAHDLLQRYLDLCTNGAVEMRELCPLNERETNMIDEIYGGLRWGRESGNIQFASERERPGFFFIDGQVRIAKTGSAEGDPIFINQDIINASSDLNTATALAILVHEYGHHYNEMEHQWLDQLGAKIKSLAQHFTYALDLGATKALEIFNFSIVQGWMPIGSLEAISSQIVWDGYDYVDISSAIYSKICTNPSHPNSREAWFGNPYVFAEHDRGHTVRMSAKYICMPDFGIGENHFWDEAVIKLSYHSLDNQELGPLVGDIEVNTVDCMRNPDQDCSN